MPVSGGVVLCSSMIANAVTTLITFPLDTIKTRQQSSTPGVRPNYTKGLFRGFTPAFLATTPCAGLYFTIFELLQHHKNPHQTLQGDIACACAAQVLCGALIIPGDILKVNLQTGTYPNLTTAVRCMTRNINWMETIVAMRHKLLLSYCRDFSFATIQMTLYVNLHRQGDTVALLAGAIAAGVASFITTPLDTLRTRHMLAADSGMKSAAMAQANYFAGLVPRVMLAAFSGLVFFRSYEVAKRVLHHTTATQQPALA